MQASRELGMLNLMVIAQRGDADALRDVHANYQAML